MRNFGVLSRYVDLAKRMCARCILTLPFDWLSEWKYVRLMYRFHHMTQVLNSLFGMTMANFQQNPTMIH